MDGGGAASGSASRKRTLDALEKRFATETLLNNNNTTFNDPKTPPIHISNHKPSSNSSRSSRPSLDTPKIGNFTFVGTTPTSQDIEEGGPVYTQLTLPVNENLLKTNEKFSVDSGCSIDSLLHEILQKGDSAQKYMQGFRNLRINSWILLDNVQQGRPLASTSQTRALKIHSKRSKKHMSMKQHKKQGSLDLPQGFHKYDLFKPMHEMWKDYMMRLLKSTAKHLLPQFLLGADLHGAIILVVGCKMAHFIGTSGIMIRETAEAFGIITEDNKFQVVPKKVSVFVFQVDSWKVTLHGDKLGERKFGL
ncbi:hypothetical protein Lal_00032381 [Lupinus albus]|uniref:Putative ribonuclease P n=1 Tax=Lupinus albus TaxID=3870 RepID=A0A6A4R8X1_LUPAL|nr:putative ribonuclease P [Lupinus albus]KAF1897624.1 hypothetical protein Lal_00032381 [Lupinus albus]